MARYIDADKLWNDRPLIPEGKSMDYGAGFSECMWGFSKEIRKQIDNPTADVIPKSEIESILDELIMGAGEIAESYKKEADKMSCSDFARIEYRGTQIGALLVQYKIAELKKKYTGGTYNSNSNELDILKSTVTRKEEDAYNKGYEDAKADILEKLQADIARDEILAEYGDELFEGRIAGFKAVMNYLNAEGEE